MSHALTSRRMAVLLLLLVLLVALARVADMPLASGAEASHRTAPVPAQVPASPTIAEPRRCGSWSFSRAQASICIPAPPGSAIFAQALYCGLMDLSPGLNVITHVDASGQHRWTWQPQIPVILQPCTWATLEGCIVDTVHPANAALQCTVGDFPLPPPVQSMAA